MIDPSKLAQLIEIAELIRRSTKPTTVTRRPTEHASLTESLKLADEIASRTAAIDVATLLSAMIADVVADRAVLKTKLEEIESTRGQILARREAFAEAVAGDKWRFVPKDRVDVYGAFEMSHTRASSVISFVGVRLRTLPFPSGAELAEAASEERAKLEAGSGAQRERILAQLAERRARGEAANWPQLHQALVDGVGRTLRGPAFAATAYGLMQLVNAREVDTRPPVLSEQDGAISLPDVETGRVRRVFGLALPSVGAS